MTLILKGMMTRHAAYSKNRPLLAPDEVIQSLSVENISTLNLTQDLGIRIVASIKQPTTSICISPWGAQLALAVLLNGSQGASFDACAQFLNLHDPYLEKFNAANTKGIDLLNARLGHEVMFATGLFSIDPIRFNKNFQDEMAETFEADVIKLGSAGQNARTQIRDWLSNHFEESSPLFNIELNKTDHLRLVSVARISLEIRAQSWSKKNGTITIADPDVQIIDVVGLKAAKVPSATGDFSVTLIDSSRLPDFKTLASRLKDTNRTLSFPNLDLTTRIDLTESLKQLGAQQLLESNNDFVLMSHDIQQRGCLTSYDQFCRFKLTIQGQEREPEMNNALIFNTPFWVVVTENKTGMVLFISRIQK